MYTSSNGRRHGLASLGVAFLLVFSAVFVLSQVPPAHADPAPLVVAYLACAVLILPVPETPNSCPADGVYDGSGSQAGQSTAAIDVILYLASTDTSTSNTAQLQLDAQGSFAVATSSPFTFNSGEASCASPLQLVVPMHGTGTIFGGDTMDLEISGLGASVALCTGDSSGYSEIELPVSTTTSVSCFPPSLAAYSVATCTATVTGDSPTGTVLFSSTSAGGAFGPSDDECTLSSGQCSVEYSDTTGGTPTISAAYQGDINNAPSTSSTALTVVAASGGSSTTTVTSTVTSSATTTSTQTVTSVSTSTDTVTTTVATEGSLETTIQANQGNPVNPGDTVFSLLYGLGSSLTSLGTTITTDFGSVNSALATVQSALSALQAGQTSLTGTITGDFAAVLSGLTSIQSTLSTLSNNIATGFSVIDSDLTSISSSLTSIQTSINNLSNSQSHSGLTGSASGETTLTSSSPSATIYTTPNGKVAIVGVSVNATLPFPSFSPQAGPLVVRFYTDPSNPNIYVQQSVYIFGVFGEGGTANAYVGTGAAWKVVLVATIPTHDSSTIKANWAVSSTGPQ